MENQTNEAAQEAPKYVAPASMAEVEARVAAKMDQEVANRAASIAEDRLHSIARSAGITFDEAKAQFGASVEAKTRAEIYSAIESQAKRHARATVMSAVDHSFGGPF